MYLQRIELEGFKSFADRTVIPVQRGLTGIVGPNGCGKSNVVDALLWVLGERSAKALRADAMEDVIFKGAEGRPPAPWCLVEVGLAEANGRFAEAGGAVTVARRLFRSGESEFLINGRKARRKDVRDLLLDTGLGVRGYMVLAQGKIDAVLAANPAERRSVFEEAAGISRYKARKQEAQRKLEAMAQDLARVEDVLGEVQRSVRSLRYQAGKARRYLEIRDQYRRARVAAALVEMRRLQEQEQGHRAAAADLEGRIDALRREREAAEERLRQLREQQDVLRRRADALRGDAARAQERSAALDERSHGLDTRAAELEQRSGVDRERLEELARAQAEERGILEGLEAERDRLERGQADLQQALAAAEADSEAARERLQAARARMEELRRAWLEAVSGRTEGQNAAAAAAERRSSLEGELAALERRAADLRAEGVEVGSALDSARRDLAAAVAALAGREGRSSELVAQRERARGATDGHAAEAGAARQRAAEASTRIAALQSVESELQGLPEPVRQVVAERPEGVSGLLLERVRVAPPWDRLVENLLGRMQHGLWADRRERAQGLPRGCLDVFFPPGPGPLPVHVAAATPLRQILEGDPECCDALCARLGEIYCTETAAEAARLAGEHPGALFLSRDGQVHGRGHARVGIDQGEDAMGILARRNALEAARSVLAEAEAAERRSAAAASAGRAALAALEEELSSLEGDLREALAARERAEARVQDLEGRERSVAEEALALEREQASLRSGAAEAAREEAGAAARRDRCEAEGGRLAAELQAQEAAAVELERACEAAQGRVQEARLHVERRAQELRHARQRAEDVGARSSRRDEERRALALELAGLRERIAAVRAEAEEARSGVRAELAERARLEERVAEVAAELEEVAARANDLQSRLDGESGRLEPLLAERQELALQLQRAELQREDLARGLQEELGQPVADLARSLGLDPQAPPEGGEAAAPDAAAAAAELRRKLEAIGPVNLEAVEELQREEERCAFLEKERADLVAARENLLATIEDLDQRCRARFVETIEGVQEHFEAIFRRLFRGGRAELSLTPDVDPLEAGIDISVRPPGKELRSINLLSGGERTLTALALLLAVFHSRPSPFCLLDEVDAALDDANVERFLDALQDFTAGTQFLVVTHNRITMARCERLFGVTMRRAGVSLVVGVELADIPEGSGIKATAGAEPREARAAAGDVAGRPKPRAEAEAAA